jgi:hypothetical protein
MHLQEHELKFDHIISDGGDLTAAVKDYSWKELGYKYEGTTQALTFDSAIKRSRNPKMFEQYSNGWVKSHSVGMQYVKIALCVNNKEYKEEYNNWQKYISQVANQQAAKDLGYFYAITEAKVIEGSAVPIGSNPITPTQETSTEPLKGTQTTILTEPPQGTQEKKTILLNFLNQ